MGRRIGDSSSKVPSRRNEIRGRRRCRQNRLAANNDASAVTTRRAIKPAGSRTATPKTRDPRNQSARMSVMAGRRGGRQGPAARGPRGGQAPPAPPGRGGPRRGRGVGGGGRRAGGALAPTRAEA